MAEEEEEEWRFAVEDVGSAESEEAPAEEGQGEGHSEAEDLPGVPESPERRPPLEPGSPSLENALFVLLGVVLTLFMVVRVMVLLGG
jgi:hypothetical protein